MLRVYKAILNATTEISVWLRSNTRNKYIIDCKSVGEGLIIALKTLYNSQKIFDYDMMYI